MPENESAPMRTDYLTGRPVPDVGAEANRQIVERLLVEQKGYGREEIERDVPIAVEIDGDTYHSRIDLVVGIDGRRLLAIKCAAGSLDSRQREIVAAARLLEERPLPLAAASDGADALVWDAADGHCLGTGLAAIPSRADLAARRAAPVPPPLDERRRAREGIVFRSYDSMNVNVQR